MADQANAANDYITPILKDDALMNQVLVLALYSYGDTPGLIRQNVHRILSSKHPNTRVWLTEYGDLGVFERSPEASGSGSVSPRAVAR